MEIVNEFPFYGTSGGDVKDGVTPISDRIVEVLGGSLKLYYEFYNVPVDGDIIHIILYHCSQTSIMGLQLYSQLRGGISLVSNQLDLSERIHGRDINKIIQYVEMNHEELFKDTTVITESSCTFFKAKKCIHGVCGNRYMRLSHRSTDYICDGIRKINSVSIKSARK